jgi:signal peptidase I
MDGVYFVGVKPVDQHLCKTTSFAFTIKTLDQKIIPVYFMTSDPKEPLIVVPQTSPDSADVPFWRRFWQAQKDNIQVLAIALILALFIRALIAEPRFIPSDSMMPTLYIGDRLVIEKVSYLFHPPTIGDIVVFEPPSALIEVGFTSDQALIKRVIGLPGQTVEVHAGKVLINHQPLQERYIAEPPRYEMLPVTVPEDQFFVMGDNRNNSNDSHVWGFLPKADIIGRAVFRFFPGDRIGKLN